MGFLDNFRKDLKKDLKKASNLTLKAGKGAASGGFDFAKDIIDNPVTSYTLNKTTDAIKYLPGAANDLASTTQDNFSSLAQRTAAGAQSLGTQAGSKALSFGSKGLDLLDEPSNFATGMVTQRFAAPVETEDGGLRAEFSRRSILQGLLAPGNINAWRKATNSNSPTSAIKGIRKSGQYWDESNLPTGLKVAGDIAFDPLNYVPIGAIGSLSAKTGLAGTALGRTLLGSKDVAATSRAARIAGGLVEGSGKYAPILAAGSGIGSEIASRTPWKWDDPVAPVLGAGLAGNAAGLAKGFSMKAAVSGEPPKKFGMEIPDPEVAAKNRADILPDSGSPFNAPAPYRPTTASERGVISSAIENNTVSQDPQFEELTRRTLEGTGKNFYDIKGENPPSPPGKDVTEVLRPNPKEDYIPGPEGLPAPDGGVNETRTIREQLNAMLWAPKELGDPTDNQLAKLENERKKFKFAPFEGFSPKPMGSYKARAAELLDRLPPEVLDENVSTFDFYQNFRKLVNSYDKSDYESLVQREAENYANVAARSRADTPPPVTDVWGRVADDLDARYGKEPVTVNPDIPATDPVVESNALDEVAYRLTNSPPPPTGGGGLKFFDADAERNKLKYASDMRPMGEIAENVKTLDAPNLVQKFIMGNLQVNPSALMNTDIGRLVTARYRQELSIQEFTNNVISVIDKHSRKLGIGEPYTKDFNLDDKGIIKSLGTHWNDVFAEPGKYNLTSGQQSFIQDYNDILDDMNVLRTIYDAGTLPRNMDGKLWVPRLVKGIDTIEIERPTNHKLDRVWELATEGAQNGVDYANPRETLQLYVYETYETIVKKQFAAEMAKITDPVEALVNPSYRENLNIAADNMYAAKNKLTEAAKLYKKDKTNPDLEDIFTRTKESYKQAAAEYRAKKYALQEEIKKYKSQEYNKAYRTLADGTKVPISTFNVVGAGERVMSREDAALLRNYIGVTGRPAVEAQSPISKGFGTTGRVMRVATSSFDFAAPFTHLLPLMTKNPKGWSKAVFNQYKSFVNPQAMSDYVSKNIDVVNEMAKYQVNTGINEYFEPFGKEGELSKLARNTIGKTKLAPVGREAGRQTIGRFQTAMDAALVTGRVELWKSLRDDYAARNNLDGLAQFVRNYTGALDSRALMVSKGQRDFESFWLAFSPKLFRSTMGLAAMATKLNTQEGREAFKALTVLSGVAVGAFATANYLMTGDEEVALDSINPTTGRKFLSVKTPAGYVGIGGQIRAVAQMMGKSTEAMKTGDFRDFVTWDQFDNPILNWYMSRGAPGVTFGQNVVEATTGANANPYSEIEGFPDLLSDTAESFLPFFAQGLLEGESVKNTAIGFFGPRATKFSRSEETSTRIQSLGLTTSDGEPITSIDQMNREQKNKFFETYPVEMANPNDNVTKMFNLIDEEERSFNADVAYRSASVYSGKMTKEQFRQWYSDRTREKYDRIDQVRESFDVIPADRSGFTGSVTQYLAGRNMRPEDQAVSDWYNISKSTPLKDDGTFDFDEVAKRRANLLIGLPPAQRAYVQRQINKPEQKAPTELVNEYDIVKDTTKPYFEANEEMFASFARDGGFFSEFDSYEGYTKWIADEAQTAGITADMLSSYLESKIPEIKTFNKTLSDYKKHLRLSDPYLDKALVDWYGFEPANPLWYMLSNKGATAEDAASDYSLAQKFKLTKKDIAALSLSSNSR